MVQLPLERLTLLVEPLLSLGKLLLIHGVKVASGVKLLFCQRLLPASQVCLLLRKLLALVVKHDLDIGKFLHDCVVKLDASLGAMPGNRVFKQASNCPLQSVLSAEKFECVEGDIFLVDRNLVLQIGVEILHEVFFSDGVRWKVIKEAFENERGVFRLYRFKEVIDRHFAVLVLLEVSMPEVDPVLAR